MTAPELHSYYQELTGQKLSLSLLRMQTWTEFRRRGLTAEDLDLVYRWTKRQAARGEGGFSELSLQFGPMVSDLDRFEDRLNLARKTRLARPQKPAPAPAAPPPPAPEVSVEFIRQTADDFYRQMGRPAPSRPSAP